MLFPAPGSLPNPGVKPESLVPPALVGGLFTTGATWEAQTTRKDIEDININDTNKNTGIPYLGLPW